MSHSRIVGLSSLIRIRVSLERDSADTQARGLVDDRINDLLSRGWSKRKAGKLKDLIDALVHLGPNKPFQPDFGDVEDQIDDMLFGAKGEGSKRAIRYVTRKFQSMWPIAA